MGNFILCVLRALLEQEEQQAEHHSGCRAYDADNQLRRRLCRRFRSFGGSDGCRGFLRFGRGVGNIAFRCTVFGRLRRCFGSEGVDFADPAEISGQPVNHLYIRGTDGFLRRAGEHGALPAVGAGFPLCDSRSERQEMCAVLRNQERYACVVRTGDAPAGVPEQIGGDAFDGESAAQIDGDLDFISLVAADERVGAVRTGVAVGQLPEPSAFVSVQSPSYAPPVDV